MVLVSSVCESTGNVWLKTYHAFEKYNINVKLANPLKTKAIADELDAKTLAHLLRSDLVAECYIANNKTSLFNFELLLAFIIHLVLLYNSIQIQHAC